jgi:regulator of nonsense transcripts 2
LAVLKELLGKDKEHVNLPLLVAFTKNFSYDVLGVKVTNIKKPVDLAAENTPESEIPLAVSTDSPLCDQETQDAFRAVVGKYFTSVKAHIVRSAKHIHEQARRNKEAYVRSGEVFADREAAFQSLVKTHEKLVSNAQVLADALGAEMPEIPAVEAQSPEESLIRGVGTGPLGRTEEFVPGGLWEDEEAKRFYEDIIDLKDRVPPTLLEDAGKAVADKTSRPASPELTREEQEGSVDGESASDTSSEHSSAPDALADTAITNKGVGQKVDLLLMRMLESSNRDLIDGVAVEFIFLNSKASRNRLVKKLIDVPRNRQDILPYYSRLIATLSRYIPDIGKLVIDEVPTCLSCNSFGWLLTGGVVEQRLSTIAEEEDAYGREISEYSVYCRTH